MQILSRKQILALEAVLDIALHARPNPVQACDITRRQGVPQRYLEQIMQALVRGDILRGIRGAKGGYRLARERRNITVGDIVRVISDIETNGKYKRPAPSARMTQNKTDTHDRTTHARTAHDNSIADAPDKYLAAPANIGQADKSGIAGLAAGLNDRLSAAVMQRLYEISIAELCENVHNHEGHKTLSELDFTI